MKMDYKNDNEFDKDQPNTSDLTEITKESIKINHTEENSYAVDATFTVETNDFGNREEQEAQSEFEPLVTAVSDTEI